MQIQNVTSFLETLAPRVLQESYDNTGLIIGKADSECTGILTALDVTEQVITDAVQNNCNLIVAHHPVIFSGLKKINGGTDVEKAIIAAIKNDIAIYAIHTNLDNVLVGVNGEIATRLNLNNCAVLLPQKNTLKKLYTFVPVDFAEKVRDSIFAAGGGHIGNYSECSFNTKGEGTFRPGEGSTPFKGNKGHTTIAEEIKIEIIFPVWLEQRICQAIIAAHPYEEVAFDIIPLDNLQQQIGSGLVGELQEPIDEIVFLGMVKQLFNIAVIKHTVLTGKKVKKVALCGGAGSFLLEAALQAEADFFLTSDIKYHEFFGANGKLVMADIGHYESEQFTIDLLFDTLRKKYLNFAVFKTQVYTNPVRYF